MYRIIIILLMITSSIYSRSALLLESGPFYHHTRAKGMDQLWNKIAGKLGEGNIAAGKWQPPVWKEGMGLQAFSGIRTSWGDFGLHVMWIPQLYSKSDIPVQDTLFQALCGFPDTVHTAAVLGCMSVKQNMHLIPVSLQYRLMRFRGLWRWGAMYNIGLLTGSHELQWETRWYSPFTAREKIKMELYPGVNLFQRIGFYGAYRMSKNFSLTAETGYLYTKLPYFKIKNTEIIQENSSRTLLWLNKTPEKNDFLIIRQYPGLDESANELILNNAPDPRYNDQKAYSTIQGFFVSLNILLQWSPEL